MIFLYTASDALRGFQEAQFLPYKVFGFILNVKEKKEERTWEKGAIYFFYCAASNEAFYTLRLELFYGSCDFFFGGTG